MTLVLARGGLRRKGEYWRLRSGVGIAVDGIMAEGLAHDGLLEEVSCRRKEWKSKYVPKAGNRKCYVVSEKGKQELEEEQGNG